MSDDAPTIKWSMTSDRDVTWSDNITGSSSVVVVRSTTARWEAYVDSGSGSGWAMCGWTSSGTGWAPWITVAMGLLAAGVSLATVGGNLVVLLSFFLQSSLRQSVTNSDVKTTCDSRPRPRSRYQWHKENPS